MTFDNVLWAPMLAEDASTPWVLHAGHFDGSDYTACGYTSDSWGIGSWMGDEIDLENPAEPRPRSRKITCPNCLFKLKMIFEHYHLRGGEFYARRPKV